MVVIERILSCTGQVWEHFVCNERKRNEVDTRVKSDLRLSSEREEGLIHHIHEPRECLGCSGRNNMKVVHMYDVQRSLLESGKK